MQTILGSTGVIGRGLARELKHYTDCVRLVSRSPQKINDNDELMSADITDAGQTFSAVEGSDVVYLTAGLKYDVRIWAEQWPKIMDNVIRACKKHGARLVFFDNVYMYGRVYGWMTEETPFNPVSRKGEIRAQIAQRLIDEYRSDSLDAVIVRSADFYGPGAATSVFNLLALDRLKNNKSAQWLFNADMPHSMTYSSDAARATAIIGNTIEAYNQTWHLPTDHNALSGKEYIGIASELLGVEPSLQVLKMWQIKLAGIFDRTIKELPELSYQNEYAYLFDSSKFEKHFKIKPTEYKEGIMSCLA